MLQTEPGFQKKEKKKKDKRRKLSS
uniref:Uncharacterized protein n=1 Tax=Nelumbo nucifera TaxID=4432 RepID=A0A822YVE4_NELNU|nr:TPA_asm: hypothetical protein HUJ06_005725 [Nelumbo nucifera]